MRGWTSCIRPDFIYSRGLSPYNRSKEVLHSYEGKVIANV